MSFTPEHVMKELMFLIRAIYTALDSGVFKAREFFEKQEYEDEKRICKYLAPNIVRFHAVRDLRRAGEDAQEDERNGINLALIPNNGIHVNYKKDGIEYEIKILKSNKGDLPVPGYSQSRRNFYDQPFFSIVEKDAFFPVKLLLLWNVDKTYTLGLLSLACPKSGEQTRESVTYHWHCRIPKRILYGEFKATDEIKHDEILDLDLDIDIEETGTDDAK